MKSNILKYIISLTVALFLFSCSEKLPLEEVNLNLTQEFTANYDEETDENFVSPNQAVEIATKFLSRESGVTTRALASARVETVKDVENSNQPAFHVVNYPEGGWAIVSATRNYFPVLAHSDEGYFDMENVPLTGVSVWFEETKEAIRVSDELDAEAKVQIRSQWLAYEEPNDRKAVSLPQTRGQLEFDNRINQLSTLYPYGTTGWQIGISLDDASSYLDTQTYLNLVGLANSFGSPTQYTIFVVKTVPLTITQNGPLFSLSRQWGQEDPFNENCPPGWVWVGSTLFIGYPENRLVGCVAVALGQIMAKHRKPALATSPTNHKYNWDNMSVSTTSSLPVLLRAIGTDVSMNYFSTDAFGNDVLS